MKLESWNFVFNPRGWLQEGSTWLFTDSVVISVGRGFALSPLQIGWRERKWNTVWKPVMDSVITENISQLWRIRITVSLKHISWKSFYLKPKNILNCEIRFKSESQLQPLWQLSSRKRGWQNRKTDFVILSNFNEFVFKNWCSIQFVESMYVDLEKFREVNRLFHPEILQTLLTLNIFSFFEWPQGHFEVCWALPSALGLFQRLR